MKIGAHISSRAPFSDAVKRAKEIGCECMQIFANPPQRWNPVVIPDTEMKKFATFNEKESILPVIIHSIYLLNLASDNPFFYEQSIRILIDEMKKAKEIGAMGVNFHVGSTKGKEFSEVLPKVKTAIKKVLDNSPDGPLIILENSAGAGSVIGDRLEELAEIIEAVKSDRIKVLIDTAHAFASGYDLRTEEDVEEFISGFDKIIGLEKLVGFHFNDSKSDFNSKHDRHADIGHGHLGVKTFEVILNHPKLKNKFAILETPEDEQNWAEQIDMLKKLRK